MASILVNIDWNFPLFRQQTLNLSYWIRLARSPSYAAPQYKHSTFVQIVCHCILAKDYSAVTGYFSSLLTIGRLPMFG